MPELRKLHLIFLILLFASQFIRPQQGAFIAPVLKISTTNEQVINLLGIKGGWVINKRFVIGAEYYALNSNVPAGWINPANGIPTLIKFTTGGLNFEYIFFRGNNISLSAEIFMGGAGINIQPSNLYGGDFLVWEPQLNTNIDLNDWSHLSLGISYRITSALDNYHIDGSGNFPPLDFSINNLWGWTFNISFIFGMY
jgi:hypothetical protein